MAPIVQDNKPAVPAQPQTVEPGPSMDTAIATAAFATNIVDHMKAIFGGMAGAAPAAAPPPPIATPPATAPTPAAPQPAAVSTAGPDQFRIGSYQMPKEFQDWYLGRDKAAAPAQAKQGTLTLHQGDKLRYKLPDGTPVEIEVGPNPLEIPMGPQAPAQASARPPSAAAAPAPAAQLSPLQKELVETIKQLQKLLTELEKSMTPAEKAEAKKGDGGGPAIVTPEGAQPVLTGAPSTLATALNQPQTLATTQRVGELSQQAQGGLPIFTTLSFLGTMYDLLNGSLGRSNGEQPGVTVARPRRDETAV